MAEGRVKLANTETFFEPLFAMFKSQKRADESFGDFCARVRRRGTLACLSSSMGLASHGRRRRLARDVCRSVVRLVLLVVIIINVENVSELGSARLSRGKPPGS